MTPEEQLIHDILVLEERKQFANNEELCKLSARQLKAVSEYASTKAEEVKKISVAFAIHMKKDILMLSDLKDNSRWNKMFNEWFAQYKKDK
ncbi:MAG TPA: hypothetical protein VMV77_15145 [Bacteroidales bacterium]|nr:hypothetical protein [Bacteroidales bacterium]